MVGIGDQLTLSGQDIFIRVTLHSTVEPATQYFLVMRIAENNQPRPDNFGFNALSARR